MAPKVREHLRDERSKFSNFFTVKEMDFEKKVKKVITKVTRQVFICTDVNGFVSEIEAIRERSLTGKIGVDVGKGSLKVTLTLFDEWAASAGSGKSRVTRASGISERDRSLTGGRKVLLLAVAPDVQESYDNIKSIFGELGEMNFMVTGDLKVYNMITGIMGGTAKCPCVYCTMKKEGKIFTGSCELRTYRSVTDSQTRWKEAGERWDKAKNFGSCVKIPLVGSCTPDTPLLYGILPIPALHLKLGVNTIVHDVMEQWPGFLEWLGLNSITTVAYFGGSLEGREVDKLLSKLPQLW